MNNRPINNSHADLFEQIRENKIKLKKVEPVHKVNEVQVEASIKQDKGLDVQDDFDDAIYLAREKANIEKAIAAEKLVAEKLAAEKLVAEQQAAKKAALALELEQAAKEKNNQIVQGKEKLYQDEENQIVARRAAIDDDENIETKKPVEPIVGMAKNTFKERQGQLSAFLKNTQSKEPAVVLPLKKDDNLKATRAILTEMLEKRIANPNNSEKQVPFQQQQNQVDEAPVFVIPDAPPLDLPASQIPKESVVTPPVAVKADESEPVVAEPQVQVQAQPSVNAILTPNKVVQDVEQVVKPAVSQHEDAPELLSMAQKIQRFDDGRNHYYKGPTNEPEPVVNKGPVAKQDVVVKASPQETVDQDALFAAKEQIRELVGKDVDFSNLDPKTIFELASDIQSRGFDDLEKVRRTPPRGRIIEPEVEMLKEKNRLAQENSNYMVALQLQQQLACLCVMTFTMQQSYLITQQAFAFCAFQMVVVQAVVVQQVFVQASYSYVQQSMFYQNAKNAERDSALETENSNPFRPIGRFR
jgi:hypothetical protein